MLELYLNVSKYFFRVFEANSKFVVLQFSFQDLSECKWVGFPKVAFFNSKLIRFWFRTHSIVILQKLIFFIAEMEIKYLQLMQNSN